MARPQKPAPPDSLPRLQKLLRETSNNIHFRHIQCVLMRVESAATSDQIAKVVAYTPEHVRRIQSAWFRDGDSALFGPGMKGWRRRETMKLEEEKEMLESMHEKAEKGEIVQAETIREECEERAGRKVHVSIVRRMIKRHKWRKVVPRPRHPKADVQAQEDYVKKNSTSR
jgi:transposase